MKPLLIASAFALALAAPAWAEGEAMDNATTSGGSTTTTMSEADCSALWTKASPNGEKLDMATASTYMTDPAKANTDTDQTIEQEEFMKACSDGMVKTSDASGSATPTPSTPSETSDRTPEKKTSTPLPQVKSVDGETSDRTPGN